MVNNEIKSDWSEFKKFWRQILSDSESGKYSMTKFAAIIGLLLYVVLVIVSTVIMIHKLEVDHVLIVETIGLVLTLLGFKNNFGFSTNKDGKQNFTMDSMQRDNNSGGSRYDNDDDDSRSNVASQPIVNVGNDLISPEESKAPVVKPKVHKPLDEIG